MQMKTIRKYLQKNRHHIIKAWYDRVIATYPQDTAKFIVNTNDPFANPVGTAIKGGLETLYDELVSEKMNREKLRLALDPILRIRAVQDFNSVQALEFVFWIKNIVRKSMAKEMKDSDFVMEILEFEDRVDILIKLAITIFVECKETLYTIRSNQCITKAYKTFKRAGLLTEFEEDTNGEVSEK